MTTEHRFEHRTGARIEVDGASIYHEVLGRGEGPPLVMLHGGFGTMEDFNPVLPDLEWPSSIIGIDSRAQGASTRGGRPLSYARLQRDVEAVLEHLGLDRCCLMGFSDGGVVAYRLASQGSVRVEALVTIGSRWHRGNLEESRGMLAGVTAKGWEKKFPDTVALYRRLNPEPDFDALAPRVVDMWLDETEAGYPDEAVERIDCPALVVRGDDDPLLSCGAAARAAESIPRGHFLNVPFAGHAAFLEQGDMFALAVNRFLEAATS